MQADTNPLTIAIDACIEKVRRWQHDNKQFGHETPRPHPVLDALTEARATGTFPDTPSGTLAQALARNEYKLTKAETAMTANRTDPVANLPNVQKFTAEIKAQAAILAEIHARFPI